MGPPQAVAGGDREDTTSAVKVGVEALKLIIAQDKAGKNC